LLKLSLSLWLSFEFSFPLFGFGCETRYSLLTIPISAPLPQLMKVLSDKKNADIITWMPSGKSFNILKPKAFVAEILPEHFKTAKYSSFTRKLHRWGFMRHYRGEEAGAFYHKDFQRGRLDLVEQMTCHKADPPKTTAPVRKAATELKAAPKPVAPKLVAKEPEVAVAPPTSKPRVSPMKLPVIKVPEVKVPMPILPQLQPQTAQPSQPVTLDSDRLSAERLNAAIELEVNRRLKVRIDAVALSRQAFAVSALRQQQLASPASQLAALLLKKQTGVASSAPPLNLAGFGYRTVDGQPSAPPKNFEGARTA
jgi:hypothetical protein